MVMTDTGKSGAALLLGPSGAVPRFLGIGTGSRTANVNVTALVSESLTARKDFTSRDIATPKEIEWTYDYGSVEMSGLTISEFGVFSGSAVTSGTCWNYEAFNGVNFDGTNELQVQVTFQIF